MNALFSVLITDLLIIILFIIFYEIAVLCVYGVWVKNSTIKYYLNLDTNKLRLNQFTHTILTTGNTFIYAVPFSFFVKYHIDGKGTVPRWSKLHRRIKQYYMIAVWKQLQEDLETK